MDTLQLIGNGLTVGSILALAAVGLTLTLGVCRVSNFAHGDFMTLGAYLTWLVNRSGLNIWLATIFGVVGTVGAMLLGERLLWRSLRPHPGASSRMAIISIGLSLFLRNGIILIWGSSDQSYNLPIVPVLSVLGLKITDYRLLVTGLSLLLLFGFILFFQKTKIGEAMRLAINNGETEVNPDRVFFWAWAIAGTLTAMGGAMYGLIATIRPAMGWFLLVQLFAAVTIGGVGNPYGAIAGAMLVGLAQELCVPWLGAEYKLGVALFILVFFLLIRPQGLFPQTLSPNNEQ